MVLKNERLWGFGDMKVLWERRWFGNLVVNNRREAEIEDEDMRESGFDFGAENSRERWILKPRRFSVIYLLCSLY
jgi:hypothetical protein